MKPEDEIDDKPSAEREGLTGENLLLPLVLGRTTRGSGNELHVGLVVGELVGLKEEGLIPLVLYPGQRGTAAVVARTSVDLHRAQIGKQVIIAFEGCDAGRPIIVGVLREGEVSDDRGCGEIQVDADGDRMIVRAKHQLVLTCGEASITLTAAGKVIIRGSYVSSCSTGVNRVTGGSIELN